MKHRLRWRRAGDCGLELSKRRYRLSSGYGQRREREEDTETSNDKDCPESEPL